MQMRCCRTRRPQRSRHGYASLASDHHFDTAAASQRTHRLRARPIEDLGNSADDYLKVHSRGASDADVTEGSGGVWERLHYDWPHRNRVVMKTTDSKIWGGRSGHICSFTRRPDGRTDIDAVVVREGKNFKGWALGLVLGSVQDSIQMAARRTS